MNLEDASRAGLSQIQEATGIPSLPNTVQGMIDLFGGGTAGKSALAHELANVRGVKYESARRNIERYTTEKPGAQTRTPKELMADLRGIAQSRTEQQTRDALKGKTVEAHFTGDVRISRDERPRDFTVEMTGEELADFAVEAQGHHWRSSADELNYALLNAWDHGRGGIVGHNGVITNVDSLSFTVR